MDKDFNKFGLYFNARGSNLSSGTTEQLNELLSDIKLGEFDDYYADSRDAGGSKELNATAEAIKVVLKERESGLPPVIGS